jgi:ornithine carbamoyltransferase
VKHFLDIDQLDAAALKALLARAAAFKADRFQDILANRTLVMIFEKPSTRTRVSFELAISELGGRAIVLDAGSTQLGRGETIGDTARVLSRYADAIMLRTDDHAKLEELAAEASVPVINGLSERSHPCQVVADLLTFEEKRGLIAGKQIAWVGDCNNVLQSWLHAAALLNFHVRIACPQSLGAGLELARWMAKNPRSATIVADPVAAVTGADCVITDSWTSMNHTNGEDRHVHFIGYCVDEALMRQAKPEAIFMHCLPAHRGQEVTDAVIDGPQSVVWDEAENRLHAQKAILEWCLL